MMAHHQFKWWLQVLIMTLLAVQMALLVLPSQMWVSASASASTMQLQALPGPALFSSSNPNSNKLLRLDQMSPASALLASEFFARERQKHLSSSARSLDTRHQLQPYSMSEHELSESADRAAISGQLSEAAVYSKALPSLHFRLDKYHPIDEINIYLESLARKYKNQVSLFSIGTSHEGRAIKALEIINNRTSPDYVWLDALTHAREWVTGSTILYIIDQILSGGSSSSGTSTSSRKVSTRMSAFMQNKNFIIIPVVNPDGYAYTWSKNRMWRKNRSPSPGTNCFGADINRNFDHSFGGEGSSLDPCSHIYAGKYAFSEAEAKSMADLMWSLKNRIKFYLTIHSYNQLWACPYASTLQESASLEKHMKVLRSIQSAVHSVEGITYEIGPLGQSLYVGSGFGLDFAYDKCKIEHSYLVELRDKGTFGFQLPEEQIMGTAKETLAGLEAGIWTALATNAK